MMGKKERSFAPLINVSLEALVPHDHFYRHLERTLDLSFVREFVQQTYACKGRPSIDPLVFFKLHLVMFFEGIRSERQLMRHAADRLSVRWYLGKELYIDSTQVNANADLDSLTPRFAVEARAAIQAHLDTLFEDTQQEQPPTAAEGADLPQTEPTAPIANGATSLPLLINLSQAEQEELASEHAARHDWIAEEGRQQREVHGLYQRTSDFKVSTTDPDATPMRLKGGGTHLGYHTHYVVDGGKARIILQVLVTPSE
jgi:hypothetical protein